MFFCAVEVGVEIRSRHRIAGAGAESKLGLGLGERPGLASTQMQSTSPRPRDDGSLDIDNTPEAPPLKKLKVDDTIEEPNTQGPASALSVTLLPDSANTTTNETILPRSHSLLGTAPPLQDENGAIIRLMESDVGISEYISKDVSKMSGIIKQRCALRFAPKDEH